MSRRVEVGFSQQIQLEWLERTTGLLLTGSTRSEIQAALDDLLKDKAPTYGCTIPTTGSGRVL